MKNQFCPVEFTLAFIRRNNLESAYARLAKAQDRLHRLERMSPLEAQAECQREYRADLVAWREHNDKRAIHAVNAKRAAAVIAAASRMSGGSCDPMAMRLVRDLRTAVRAAGAYINEQSGDALPMPKLKRWEAWLAAEKANARFMIDYWHEEASYHHHARWMLIQAADAT